MANTTAAAVGNQQLYSDYVLQGFVATIAPLRSFSFDVSPLPAEKGQTVNVAYVASGSTPGTWAEATGYAMQASTRAAISVALSNHKYVSSYLTDIEVANSSLMRIQDQALANGRALGLAVLTDCINAVTASSYLNYTYAASSSLWTIDKLVEARKTAATLNWGLTRNVIVNPTIYYYLLKDDDLKYIYRGSTGAVEQGQLTNVFGWNNVYEASGFPTMYTGSGPVAGTDTVAGLAVTPDALAVAVRYLQPQPEAAGIVESYPVTDPATGITIGFRKWYDPNYGQTRTVYECVWGKAVANTNAAISLTYHQDA